MDINSRMVMKPGMQLTAEAMNNLIGAFHSRQAAAFCIANAGRIGVMPGHKNRVHGVFVRDTFEVDVEDLLAVMPAGDLLNINEQAVVKVPLLYGERYYLVAKLTDTLVPFEAEGLPFVRNEYAYSIATYDEMLSENAFPLVRFAVRDGVFSVDEQFIMPAVTVGSDERIITVLREIADALQELAKHPNLAKSEVRQTLFSCSFRLMSVGANWDMQQVEVLLGESANALRYLMNVETTHASSVHGDGVETTHASSVLGDGVETTHASSVQDIESWMGWLKEYIGSVVSVVDNLEIEEEKIDLESIKQELRAEIYEHLQPDLEQMVNDRVDNLSEMLQQRIEEALRDYVNGTVMDELHDRLRTELDGDLRATLYADLYQSLYSVLFVPKEEEESYVPLI